MSHIFDALQRSEAKRAKSDAPLSLAATELLERAERAAASQWKAEAEAEQPMEQQRDRTNLIFGAGGFGHVPDEEDVAAVTRARDAETHRECLSQFQTLKTSLPDNSRLVCLTDAVSPAAEAFRLLGVRLRHLRTSCNLKTLLITSTVPEEGKSMAAANLACSLASGGQQKVLLLEGDTRRPSLAQLFGLPTVAGLCNCLEGERSLTASVYRLQEPGLWILPAGDQLAGHAELLQSPQLPVLLQELKTWFNWIVIDSPPVLPLADTSIWARLADGILLVARRGTTEKRKLQKGLESLDSHKLIGALMNCSTGTANGDYYYYRPTSESSQEAAGG